jgi:hypothetical protein
VNPNSGEGAGHDGIPALKKNLFGALLPVFLHRSWKFVHSVVFPLPPQSHKGQNPQRILRSRTRIFGHYSLLIPTTYLPYPPTYIPAPPEQRSTNSNGQPCASGSDASYSSYRISRTRFLSALPQHGPRSIAGNTRECCHDRQQSCRQH